MRHGQCLCGAVKYEVEPPLGESAHCHCEYCRRAHGAAFVTWVAVPAARFKMNGGETLRWYRSSAQAERGFCSRCGCPLFYRSSLTPEEIDVTRASFTDDPGVTPRYHCFVDQKAEWVTLPDGDGLERLCATSPALAKYRAIPPPT